MRRRPDILVVLTAAFVLGVVITLVLPVSAGSTTPVPASPLQAGIIGSR